MVCLLWKDVADLNLGARKSFETMVGFKYAKWLFIQETSLSDVCILNIQQIAKNESSWNNAHVPAFGLTRV